MTSVMGVVTVADTCRGSSTCHSALTTLRGRDLLSRFQGGRGNRTTERLSNLPEVTARAYQGLVLWLESFSAQHPVNNVNESTTDRPSVLPPQLARHLSFTESPAQLRTGAEAPGRWRLPGWSPRPAPRGCSSGSLLGRRQDAYSGCSTPLRL